MALWLLAALMITVVGGADPGGSVSPVEMDDATLKSLEGRILNQIETSGHQGQHSGRRVRFMDLQSLESKIMNQIKAPVVRKRTTPNRVSALGSSSEGKSVALPNYIKSADGKCLGIAEGHTLQFEHFLCSKFEPSAHWMLQGTHLKARTKPHLCLHKEASDIVTVVNCDVTPSGWALKSNTTSEGPQVAVDGSENMCLALGSTSKSPDSTTHAENSTKTFSSLAVRACDKDDSAVHLAEVLEKTDITQLSCFSDWSSAEASLPHKRHCVKRLQAKDSHRDITINLENIDQPTPATVLGLLALFESASLNSTVEEEDGCVAKETMVKDQLQQYAEQLAQLASATETAAKSTSSTAKNNGTNSSANPSINGTNGSDAKAPAEASVVTDVGEAPAEGSILKIPVTEVSMSINFNCDLRKSVSCEHKDELKEQCASSKSCGCQGYSIMSIFLIRGEAAPVSGCVRRMIKCAPPSVWPSELNTYDPFRGDACRSPCAMF